MMPHEQQSRNSLLLFPVIEVAFGDQILPPSWNNSFTFN